MLVEKYGWAIKKSLFAETNQDSIFSQTRENSKMFNITSKYFSLFNNKPPESWVVHITRDFFTCYSCLYYSSMDSAKTLEREGIFHQPAFVGNCYSHVFSLLHPLDEFYLKGMRTWSQSMAWIKRIRRQSNYKISNTNGEKLLLRFSSSCRKLLDRFAFRNLSNINDGVLLRKYVEHL